MKALPDVAALLFTNEYRAVKLKGKKHRKPAAGTGSCFDATDPEEVSAAYLKASKKAAEGLTLADPVWDKATCSYRLRSPKRGPQDFIKAGSGAFDLGKKTNNVPLGPASPGAFKPKQNLPDTAFRKAYERGDLPIAVDHKGLKNVISWKADVGKLDYSYYLPLFFDGIREVQEPYRFLAVKGCEDLLQAGGNAILPVIPYLVQPLKRALTTRDEQVMIIGLKLLQKLIVSCEMAGEALLPHYRQLLPVCHQYAQKNLNLGDAIDYAQHEGNCLGEVIKDTLNLLEVHGGPDSFINIKYLVPTYESVCNY